MKKEIKKTKKRTAALHNLGCKVNAYETESMQQMLEAAGYTIVDFDKTADVYVINTCSVTNMADRKSRQMIHRARSKNPDAVIVAAGCYVQTAGEEIKQDLSIDILIGNNKKAELIPLLDQYFEDHVHAVDVIDINDGVQSYEELTLAKTGEHTRAFLKVQDGCNQFCSYCIIPYARGRVRSRDPRNVYEEALQLADNGYREIVLTGIHLSSYGAGEEFGLLELIKLVHKIPGIERIRLGSLEPRIITEAFAEQLKQLPKVCPHFHLSLQSGCDETLVRMNRKYTAEEYAHSCELLRSVYEHPAITTDVIVGFPGETPEEFEQSKQFLERIGFYEMHVFQYSKRHGTRAERMPDQVPEPLKKERSAVLLSLEKEQSRAFRDFYIGKQQTVLFEEALQLGEKRYMVGFTPEYVRLAMELAPGMEESAYVNRLCCGTVGEALTEELYLFRLS
ncbi:MAG: tRNA (N(6)-L-threonylcarbamoyladenosine(37)-C(2))-methylthiotransferase MtaB [bacterium]|nr:tRNA (N(6)-L-threonylcarbamoyladenosine(37)-C(2))-methylthiotransferase MtaB [bacterium]MDY4099356.1 tRNA (N(6)-L-threonylcarbamoyladenosine(37)-C(2))-methylthiotransferase MtaB [Lachnospiraceae bacterium]